MEKGRKLAIVTDCPCCNGIYGQPLCDCIWTFSDKSFSYDERVPVGYKVTYCLFPSFHYAKCEDKPTLMWCCNIGEWIEAEHMLSDEYKHNWVYYRYVNPKYIIPSGQV